MNRWPAELGLPGIDTASVNDARRKAKAGFHGWAYHEGIDGVQVGHFVDWDPEVLGDPDDRHVSCVAEIDRFGRIKSVGSGGPSGKVAFQPRNGGFNPPEYFVGYFIAPTAPAAAQPPQEAAQGHTAAKVYTVRAGEDLIRIAKAHRTTVPAILKANPPAADHRTRDFHISRASYILAGQKLHMP